MEADVPLGAFLSGGIDSSTIVAMMQSQTVKPARTFTIAFSEASYDESGPARAVAAYLGTSHTELAVTPKDALDVIPRLAYAYDEPFADTSQIPTCLISRLTRRNVTVALSGDGGDELFGGYYRHFMAPILWKRLAGLPHPLRQAAAAIAYHLPESLFHNFFAVATKVGGKSWRTAKSAGRIQKFFNILQAPTADVMYRNLLTYWKNPQRLFENGVTVENPVTDLTEGLPVLQNNLGSVDDITCRIMLADARSYLPDDILTKVDRASMGVSLEARVPILDHRVVEFAWQLPLSMKIRNGQGKWILRQVLYKYVPRELVERPKSGFGIPIDSWLLGPLRDWAEELLNESRLRQEGFFNPQPIRKKWMEHLSDKRSWAYHLWNVLMFQGWLEKNK